MRAKTILAMRFLVSLDGMDARTTDTNKSGRTVALEVTPRASREDQRGHRTRQVVTDIARRHRRWQLATAAPYDDVWPTVPHGIATSAADMIMLACQVSVSR
jgi:hypothetical protein